MILQSLCAHYKRLAATEGLNIAQEGFAPQKISFAFDLSAEGKLKNVIDLRLPEGKGGKLIPRTVILPALGKSRTTDITPFFLWDKTKYCLGSDSSDKITDAYAAFEAFIKIHKELFEGINTQETSAFLAFLTSWEPEQAKNLPGWEEIVDTNIVFSIEGRYLHECNELTALWPKTVNPSRIMGTCLVTGEHTEIAMLHPSIKGVVGAQSSGAQLCSFNIDSFTSYDKEKGMNAPMGKWAAFAYTTALNYLLQERQQTIRLGNTTAICWAEKEHPLEQGLLSLIAGQNSDDGQVDANSAIERTTLLRTISKGYNWQGDVTDIPLDTSLYLLGITPNASRLAITYFLQGSALGFLEKIGQYYRELSISRYENDVEYPSVWQLARAMLAPQKRIDEISRVGGDLLQTLLAGYHYPSFALPSVLARLRAGENINSVRAGLIKAILIRNFNCEVTVKLNPDHPSQAYHLGRVFALLYGLQRKAIPGINASIREKFYSAASTTPSIVFPMLLANAQNHIKKANAGLYDKLITEILGIHVETFPKHLTLQEQGEFALGYYHQRVNPDSKKEEAEQPTEANEEA